jgi:hypothetical protein
MPKRCLPPRLYLRTGRSDRHPVWVIKDNGRETSTGFRQEQIEEAKSELLSYCAREGIDGSDPDLRHLVNGEGQFGTVYFVTAHIPNFPIKVGFTASEGLNARLVSLQTGNPYRLYVLASRAAFMSLEADMLRRFAHLRMEGEWLRRTRHLMAYIEKHFPHIGGAPLDMGPKGGPNGRNRDVNAVESIELSL